MCWNFIAPLNAEIQPEIRAVKKIFNMFRVYFKLFTSCLKHSC